MTELTPQFDREAIIDEARSIRMIDENDIQIDDAAAIEAVDDGYWVTARLWVYDQ